LVFCLGGLGLGCGLERWCCVWGGVGGFECVGFEVCGGLGVWGLSVWELGRVGVWV